MATTARFDLKLEKGENGVAVVSDYLTRFASQLRRCGISQTYVLV